MNIGFAFLAIIYLLYILYILDVFAYSSLRASRWYLAME